MSLLFSAAVAASFTGEFAKHFDTFAQWTPIVVNKEPIKSLNVSVPTYNSYGNDDNNQDYTLIPVSATFSGIVIYPPQKVDLENKTAKFMLASNQVMIKVKQEARDYINNGKTENVIVDGNIYNVSTTYKVQHYLGLEYYYFTLEGSY